MAFLHPYIDQPKRQYLVEFALLAPDQATWNHDYEQFVVAFNR